MERTRGIIGHVMPDKVTGRGYDKYLLVVRPDGKARMVHTEGVAYEVTPDKPWCWTDYSDTEKKWSLEELTALDTHTADLADWVRVFGSRLESNFRLIRSWYEEVL